MIRINRSTLLEDILQHRGVFNALMENIEVRGSKNEFDTHLYKRLYHDKICKQATDNRQKDRLSMQSLIDNGVFIHVNVNDGTTAIQPVLIGVLRFISEKKSVAMNHAGFKMLIACFDTLQKNIDENGRVDGEEYDLLMQEFKQLLSQAISEVRQSIEALEQNVVDLATQYKKLQEEGSSFESETKLLKMISHLHEYYALPCYQFIDEDAVLTDKLTVTQSIDKMIDFHSRFGAVESQMSLQYGKIMLTSFYKDIESIVSNLNNYSQSLSQNRQKYMAIDAAFESLMVDVRELRHGRRNKAKLTLSSSFLDFMPCFDAMVNKPMFQKRLDWVDRISVMRFEEWLRSETGEEKKVNEALLQPVHSMPSPTSQKRQDIVLSVMSGFRLPRGAVNDVVVHLHEWSQKHIEDYVFIDLLSALEGFYGVYKKPMLERSMEKKRLVYEGYYFDYLLVGKKGIAA